MTVIPSSGRLGGGINLSYSLFREAKRRRLHPVIPSSGRLQGRVYTLLFSLREARMEGFSLFSSPQGG